MLRGKINKLVPIYPIKNNKFNTFISFQGCNYNCNFCNCPETINTCKGCGTCAFICPFNAVEFLGDHVKWHEDKCKHCGLCVKNCKNHCGPRTKTLSVGEVIKEILKVKSKICGILISGGECTLQKDFLIDLFEKIHKLGLEITIHTNGSMDFSKNEDFINNVDKVILDVKSFENEEHILLTGVDNFSVMHNISYLAKHNKLYKVCSLIIPDLLNNIHNVDNISSKIANLDSNIEYNLIKFNPKNTLGKINAKQPTNQEMDYFKKIAIKNGCTNVSIS